MARNKFSRFDADLFSRADDEGEPVEANGIEKMVADAVSDLRGFCDSMRADFDGLKSRMDSMETSRADATEVPTGAEAGIAAAAMPSDDGAVVHPPATDIKSEDADAALAAASPVEIAADASGWIDTPEGRIRNFHKKEEEQKNAAQKNDADMGMDMASMADSAAERAAAPLRADIARLSRMIPAELTIEQRQQFAAAQEQAEVAFQSFGDHAPAPMQGEGIGTYKRRLAAKLQPHSERWKATKLTGISDDATLDVIVADIYNDAASVARRGSDVVAGNLMPVTRRTPAGHTIVEYRGSPGAWMRPLAGATRRATGKFNTGR